MKCTEAHPNLAAFVLGGLLRPRRQLRSGIIWILALVAKDNSKSFAR